MPAIVTLSKQCVSLKGLNVKHLYLKVLVKLSLLRWPVPSADTGAPPLILLGILLIMFTFWNCVSLTTSKRTLPKFLISPMYLWVWVEWEWGGPWGKENNEIRGGSWQLGKQFLKRKLKKKKKKKKTKNLFFWEKATGHWRYIYTWSIKPLSILLHNELEIFWNRFS